jgi:hypothetical protein
VKTGERFELGGRACVVKTYANGRLVYTFEGKDRDHVVAGGDAKRIVAAHEKRLRRRFFSPEMMRAASWSLVREGLL